MVFAPKFFAVQEEGLIDNVLTIVQRDFKEALDVFYPIESALPVTDSRHLLDFREHILGQIGGNVFPSLAVGPDRTASTISDASDRLTSAVRFSSWIGVTDDSHENVTRRIMRYVSTYEHVLRTAATKNKSDFFRNMSSQVFGFVLDEIEHIYGPVGYNDSTYFRSARVNGTIVIHET